MQRPSDLPKGCKDHHIFQKSEIKNSSESSKIHLFKKVYYLVHQFLAVVFKAFPTICSILCSKSLLIRCITLSCETRNISTLSKYKTNSFYLVKFPVQWSVQLIIKALSFCWRILTSSFRSFIASGCFLNWVLSYFVFPNWLSPMAAVLSDTVSQFSGFLNNIFQFLLSLHWLCLS